MRFSEYVRIRGGGILCQKEAEALGVDMMRNWKRRYKNLELTNSQVTQACAALSVSGSKHKGKATKILSMLTKDEVILLEDRKQYLYLMCNILGLYKVGISVAPKDRAKQLSNTSGVPVALVAVWETSCEARTLESALHKEFKVFRKRGEWFGFESYPVSYIERYLTSTVFCTKRVYENPHAAESMFLAGEDSSTPKPWSSLFYKEWFSS